jgi:protein-arginine kinase activator protein McsA
MLKFAIEREYYEKAAILRNFLENKQLWTHQN